MPNRSHPNSSASPDGAEDRPQHLHGRGCQAQRLHELRRAIAALRPALERIELVDGAEAEYALVDEVLRGMSRRLDMTLAERLGPVAAE